MSRLVLAVDDDPLVLDVTASMLEDLGCEVVTAANGNDALRHLSMHEPARDVDTVVVDSLKALDPNRPIREATELPRSSEMTDQCRRSAKAEVRHMLAANKSHRPGMPLSSNDPRSENFRPAPATRSVTTRDTSTSFGPDCAMTRAAE